MKNIEDKIGRDPDPLHKHQYFKSIINYKNFEFNKNSKKILKANCDRTLECTHGRTEYLNNSTTHSEERDNFEKCRFEPTAVLKDSKLFKNINIENFDKLPTKQTHIQELSFSNNIFKNIYYCSTQEDLKNIEDKIGRDPDPLHKHQYFKSIIDYKNFEFNENSKKILKANCDRTLECTHGRTKYLNNSMTHSDERDNFEKCRFEPTAELKDSNFF